MAGAENVVRELINKTLEQRKVTKKDFDIKPICTEGANYTTVLYTISVSTEEEHLELFAKVASITGEIRKYMNGDWIYETERFVYLTLSKIYDGLQDKYDVPEEHRFVFPKCYGIDNKQGQETVLLENLATKGYKPYSRFESMDWEHAAISVEQLAKFHALSFAYSKENPEEFQKLLSTMVHRTGTKDNEHMLTVWVRMVERGLEVLDDEHKHRIRELLMQQDFLEKYNKPNFKPVLCHGDYRLSNILFRRQGEAVQAIPVDYQMVYSGCPPADLIYFICMGSDEEFRRQHFDRLVDHYYESLCQAMRRLEVDPVEAYPKEAFDEHMKEVLPYVLFLGVTILPVVTVEAEVAPRIDDGADLSTFVVETNALYTARFRGLVNDCVRWGVI